MMNYFYKLSSLQECRWYNFSVFYPRAQDCSIFLSRGRCLSLPWCFFVPCVGSMLYSLMPQILLWAKEVSWGQDFQGRIRFRQAPYHHHKKCTTSHLCGLFRQWIWGTVEMCKPCLICEGSCWWLVTVVRFLYKKRKKKSYPVQDNRSTSRQAQRIVPNLNEIPKFHDQKCPAVLISIHFKDKICRGNWMETMKQFTIYKKESVSIFNVCCFEIYMILIVSSKYHYNSQVRLIIWSI